MPSDVPRTREFVLGGSIHENVKALRVALGSVVAELSAARLAALVSERHANRSVSPSLVQRWEAGVEPDYESTRIMAELAGVSFEEFALGAPAKRGRGAKQGRGTPAGRGKGGKRESA